MKRAAKRDLESAPELPSVELTVPVAVQDDTMYLRTAMASAEAEHEGVTYKFDAATHIAGASVIIGISVEGVMGWRNYVFSTEGLIRAAFDEYLRNPRPVPVAEVGS